MIHDSLKRSHEGTVKCAVVGALARVGKILVKRPMATINQGFNMMDTASKSGRISDAISGAHNLAAAASAPRSITM